MLRGLKYTAPHPIIYTLRWFLQRFLWNQFHSKAHATTGGDGKMAMHQVGP